MIPKTKSLKESLSLEFKKLSFFYLTITSLLIAGSLAAKNSSITNSMILGLAGLCGVFLIYGIHAPMNQKSIIKQCIQFFNIQNKKFFLIVLLVSLPIFMQVLTPFSMFMFGIIGFMGVFYSITFTFYKRTFKLKDFLIVKNTLIGISWGVLVLAGAGVYNNNVIFITILVVLQVFIGSMIRDLPDIEKDRQNGVNTFPVFLGERKSIIFMHLLNLGSFLILTIITPTYFFSILIVLVVVWRTINLFKLSKEKNSKIWLQHLNLFTCILIFLILLFRYVFEYI